MAMVEQQDRPEKNHTDEAGLPVSWSALLAACSRSLRRQPRDLADQQALLEKSLEQVRKALNASRAYYFRCFDDPALGPCIGNAAMSCIPGIPDQMLQGSDRVPFHVLPNVMRSAFEQQKPIGGPIVEVFADSPYWRDRYLLQNPPLLSVQLVPLHIDDVQWGFIGVDDVTSPRHWTTQEIAFLDTAGEILGSALHRWSTSQRLEEEVRARTLELQQSNESLVASNLRAERILETLEQRLVERTREVAAFFDISMLAGQDVPLSDLLMRATEQIAQIGHCEGISVHLFSNEGKTLTMVSQQGLTATESEQIHDLSPWVDQLMARTEQQAFVSRTNAGRFLPRALRLRNFQHCLISRLHMRGGPIGLLIAYRRQDTPFNIDNVSLLTIMSELLSLVVENHRLYFEAQKSAVESERQRLAHELHDSITQMLYSQTVFARSARYAVEDENRAKLIDSLGHIEESSLSMLKEMRLLLFQLQPLALIETGLTAAIHHRFQMVEDRLHIRTHVHFDQELYFDGDTRFEIYRIIMEALNNSLKHANAAQVYVTSQVTKECILITIGDDGIGFDPSAVKPGLGLKYLRERVKQIHGELTIHSNPGAGTQILVQLPRMQ